MNSLAEAFETISDAGYVCRHVSWELGPSLSISKGPGRFVGDLQLVPYTVFVAPDHEGWCVIDKGGESVINKLTDLSEAVNVAIRCLENEHT